MEQELKELGLTDNESKIYLHLLKRNKQTATKIAKETKIKRTVVYSCIDSLIHKGLVSSVVINGVNCYSSNNPSTLMDFLKNKELTLKEILPKLLNIKKEEKEEVRVELFEGLQGGIAVMDDIIKSCKEYCGFGNDESFQRLGTIAEQYIRKLNEKGIKEKLVVREGEKPMIGKNSQIRYLPKEVDMPAATVIYGNKVGITILDKPYYVVLIESKIIARTYKNIFEHLWGIAKNK